MSNSYRDYLRRKQGEHGDKFDPSDLSQKFVEYYESGQRIIVETPWGEQERGYVGVTTGWKPSFLLVHRISDRGSSTLLNDNYKIVGTVSKYRP